MELTYKIYEHYKEEFAIKRCDLLSINVVGSPFYFSQYRESVSLHMSGLVLGYNLSPKAIIKILRLTGSHNG